MASSHPLIHSWQRVLPPMRSLSIAARMKKRRVWPPLNNRHGVTNERRSKALQSVRPAFALADGAARHRDVVHRRGDGGHFIFMASDAARDSQAAGHSD